MSCKVCGRGACMAAFHSFAEQEQAAAEIEFAEKLVRNGWGMDEARAEAKRALADAAEEDGYDGP